MSDVKCAECPLRAKYDVKPKSFAGRFWHWHINIFPGWKAYMTGLPDAKRREIAAHYDIKKYLN